jgi:anti-sigma-K factor RskA
MSNPQDNSRLEELAALDALNLLDESSSKELIETARTDQEVARLVRDFSETAAQLAHEPDGIKPPPELRDQILRHLPAPKGRSQVIPFPMLIPYAIAACLMILGLSQALQMITLKRKLAVTSLDDEKMRQSNALVSLRLALLEAKDSAYAASKVMVAWDPYQNRGMLALQDLPQPPAGHDYQLWVLDPNAPAPISAGLITGAKSFGVPPISTPNPGFAISLEPTGGSPSPTGPILFAVAPGS